MNNSTVTEHLLLNRISQLEEVLEYIDELHSAVSEGESLAFTGLDEMEVLNTLREIIYTAQEAATEIETARAKRRNKRSKQPVLHIMPKVEKAG
jgi:hypothetical protein